MLRSLASCVGVLGLLLVPRASLAQHAPAAPHVLLASGEVELTQPSAHLPGVDEEMPPGSRLRVTGSGRATVTLHGAQVHSSGDAELATPAATAVPPPLPPPPLLLNRGAVVIEVNQAAGGHPLTLGTTGCLVTVERGRVRVEVDASRSTRVSAVEGRAHVVIPGRTLVVPAGQGLRVDSAHRAMPVRALPAAPTFARPFPAAMLSSGAPVEVSAELGVAPTVVAPWHLHVRVARDEHFENLVDDRRHEVGLQQTLRGLAPGVYFAHFSVVDSEGFESAPLAARLAIVTPRMVPSTEGRHGGVEVPPGHFCSLDNGRFEAAGTVLTMAPARPHAMRCATRADGQNAVAVPIAASATGRLNVQFRVSGGDWEPEGGMRAITLTVRDAADLPLSLATIRVEANAGVSIGAPREGDRRGTYTGSFSWPRGQRAVDLVFVINESERIPFHFGPAQ